MSGQTPRRVRSFVLRHGRMTPGQRRAFEDHWRRFGLEREQGTLEPQRVFGRSAPLVLEIGFGMGDSLAAMVEAAPEQNFVGIEVHRPGVGRLLNAAAERDLDNLRIYCEDAVEVLRDCIADNSLDRVQIYFPDPWPKKKHHKRRLIQPEFVALLHRKLRPGGLLHLATDWENYAEHMLVVLEEAEGLVNRAGTGVYSPRPGWRPITRFERRGEGLGHGVWDLLFEKEEASRRSLSR